MLTMSNCTRVLRNKIANAILCFCCCYLVACSSADKNIDQMNVSLVMTSSLSTNPDIKKQAAPVSVSIYQLKSVDAFQNSDYFSLVEGHDTFLANELTKTDKIMLRPGESRKLEIHADADVIALGFVAAYRDLEHADWQKIYYLKKEDQRPWYKKIFSKKQTILHVRFDQLTISMNEME